MLQTANNSTYAEASSRSTLYVMVLSSSLVATGFVAGSTDSVAPIRRDCAAGGFCAGPFYRHKAGRNFAEKPRHYLDGIARIRAYYRTLGPVAAKPLLT